MIDAIKALSSKASSIEEMRAVNEKMARPAEPELNASRFLPMGSRRNGSARRAPPDRTVLYLHGGGYVMGP